MDEHLELKYFDRLFDLLTEHKKKLFSQIVKKRTNHIAWLTDNLYHEQNSSAIVRTADCFGFNRIFVLKDTYSFKINKEIAMGAEKWITPHPLDVQTDKYAYAVQEIKNRGYRLIAASQHSDESTVENLDISSPVCIALGSERHGLHKEILESADGFVRIPMMGFTESLNVSVTAGILMYQLRKRLESEGISWQLTPREEKELVYQWMLKTIPNASKMIQRWMDDQSERVHQK